MRILGGVVLFFWGFSALSAQSLDVTEPILVPEFESAIVPVEEVDLIRGDVSQLTIEEVNLEKNSTLILPPFQSVVINHLIAKEGAKIHYLQSQTSEDEAKATQMFFRQVRGHVLIEAKGIDGVDGRNGRAGRQGAEGRRGRDARTLFFGLFYLGDGEDGGGGLAGEDGEDGEEGKDGGDGARVSVYYVGKSDDSKFVIDVSGGAGGRGGRGGIAGLGGNGGAGGEGIRDGRQGAMGSMGQAGRAGRSGVPGLPGEASVTQVSDELFFCLMDLSARALSGGLQDQDFDQCRALAKASPPVEQEFQSPSAAIVADFDGIFYLNADGQRGADAPAAVGPGMSGQSAMNGGHGGAVTIVLRELPTRAFVSARGGDGGRGADGRAGRRGADGKDGRSGKLFRKAKPGSDGQPGQDGGQGSDGGAGGAGGKINIVYIPIDGVFAKNWSDRFHVNVDGGQGGPAGHGAPGGLGGAAGRGGKKFMSRRHADDGRPGDEGSTGKAGQAGAQGESGIVKFFEADDFGDWVIDSFRERLNS